VSNTSDATIIRNMTIMGVTVLVLLVGLISLAKTITG